MFNSWLTFWVQNKLWLPKTYWRFLWHHLILFYILIEGNWFQWGVFSGHQELLCSSLWMAGCVTKRSGFVLLSDWWDHIDMMCLPHGETCLVPLSLGPCTCSPEETISGPSMCPSHLILEAQLDQRPGKGKTLSYVAANRFGAFLLPLILAFC